MTLSAGDVPTMYTVLANSLSVDEATRQHPAESALAQCEPRPEFCSYLLVSGPIPASPSPHSL